MPQVTTEQWVEGIQEKLMNLLMKKKDALPPGFNEKRFALNCITVINDMLKDSKKRDALQKVNPETIPVCMIKAAYLGLDFLNGECYAIPYGNSMNFQTDYKGEIKVCKQFSSDPIKDIYAKVVREGDFFEEGVEDGIQKVNFKPIPFSDKPIIGAFAVVLYKDGTMKYDTMSKEEIEHTRKVYSKAQNSQAWKESSGEMYKKTVIRRLSKLIDKNLDSVEQIRAYEDGSGFEFENQVGTNTRKPAQLPGADTVVDAFAKQPAAIEEKPQPMTTPQDFRSQRTPEPVPAEPRYEQQEMPPFDPDFQIPDEELPFR
jgi:recombination protein RecT